MLQMFFSTPQHSYVLSSLHSYYSIIMGNYSWLFDTRNNAEGCLINWDAMDAEQFKNVYILDKEYNKSPAERAKTLADRARVWHDTKFIGYFDESYVSALEEFCRHLVPYGSYPRLYYDYEGWEELWCIEFIPGSGVVNWATYKYHHLMNDKPKHPEDISDTYTVEDETAWCEAMDAYKNKVFASIVDAEGWKFNRLKHVKMSDEDALRLLIARIHGLV